MEAVNGHKGITVFTVTVHRPRGPLQPDPARRLGGDGGGEADGLADRPAERLERDADPASPFTPKGATLTIGLVNGGTAGNILARECSFLFDLRCPPRPRPARRAGALLRRRRAMDAALKARAPEAGVRIELHSRLPPLRPETGRRRRGLRPPTGRRQRPGARGVLRHRSRPVPAAGFSTVICGPGSIEQAHQPDEYVEISQMERGAAFMRRLVEAMTRPV